MNANGSSIIVVGVDGTNIGQTALSFAVREAALRGSALEVVTTWEWLAPYDETYRHGPEDARRRAEQAQEKAISMALKDADAPPVVSRHVLEGDPGKSLVHLASTAHADFLVVGSHRKRALARAVLGSVSEYCVRHAHCPVVVVPTVAESKVDHAADLEAAP